MWHEWKRSLTAHHYYRLLKSWKAFVRDSEKHACGWTIVPVWDEIVCFRNMFGNLERNTDSLFWHSCINARVRIQWTWIYNFLTSVYSKKENKHGFIFKEESVSTACESKTHCHVMVFWVVARVLLGCYGQLLVFLRVCQGVLDGCQDVAMWLLGCLGWFIACSKLPAMIGCLLEVARVFWAVACVAVCLPGCFYLVARVLWLVSCLCKTPCYYLGDVLLSGSCCGWFLVLLCGCRGIWCNFHAYVWLPEC